MFNGFKRRRVSILNEKEEREIQITPFIDVVLVLLIIFMITSPAVLSGVTIDGEINSYEILNSRRYKSMRVWHVKVNEAPKNAFTHF